MGFTKFLHWNDQELTMKQDVISQYKSVLIVLVYTIVMSGFSWATDNTEDAARAREVKKCSAAAVKLLVPLFPAAFIAIEDRFLPVRIPAFSNDFAIVVPRVRPSLNQECHCLIVNCYHSKPQKGITPLWYLTPTGSGLKWATLVLSGRLCFSTQHLRARRHHLDHRLDPLLLSPQLSYRLSQARSGAWLQCSRLTVFDCSPIPLQVQRRASSSLHCPDIASNPRLVNCQWFLDRVFLVAGLVPFIFQWKVVLFHTEKLRFQMLVRNFEYFDLESPQQ